MLLKKGVDVRLSQNFTSREFDCRCDSPLCQSTVVEELLVESLELLREGSGPLVVLSGFRCEEHNARVGGVKDSQHLLGRAADVRASRGLSPNSVAQLAGAVRAFAAGGIGIYRDLNFTHLDVRDDGPARWTHPIKC